MNVERASQRVKFMASVGLLLSLGKQIGFNLFNHEVLQAHGWWNIFGLVAMLSSPINHFIPGKVIFPFNFELN